MSLAVAMVGEKKLISYCYNKNALPIKNLICKIFWKNKIPIGLL